MVSSYIISFLIVLAALLFVEKLPKQLNNIIKNLQYEFFNCARKKCVHNNLLAKETE